MAKVELTLEVSAFGAKSEWLFHEMARGRLAGVTVVSEGQPVAIVSSVQPRLGVELDEWRHAMRDSVGVQPGIDLTKPLIDWDWEAEMRRDWDEQMR